MVRATQRKRRRQVSFSANPSHAISVVPSPSPITFWVKRQKVLNLLIGRWFHGDIDASSAAQLLSAEGPGSFLVRYSSQPGAFTLSSMSSSGLSSLRILQPSGCGCGFVLDDEHRFPTLSLLVEALKGLLKHACHLCINPAALTNLIFSMHNSKFSQPGPLRLEKPCSGSSFQRIFNEPTYVPLYQGTDTAAGNYGRVQDVLGRT